MDPILFDRYFALLIAYRAEFGGELEEIKRKLIEETRSGFLRPDAALLLLSLYDEMILRPYTEHLYFLPTPNVDHPLPNIGRDLRGFRGRVQRSLDVIFERLQMVQERPISSHQVLLALVNAWPTLSELYGWG